jgi:hypothetical protein
MNKIVHSQTIDVTVKENTLQLPNSSSHEHVIQDNFVDQKKNKTWLTMK